MPLRQIATSARVVVSRRRLAPHASFNIKKYSTSQPPKRDSPTTVVATFAGLFAGACTFYYISQSGSPETAPLLTEAASETTLTIKSPVKVYDLAEANAKLRREATSFTFGAKGGPGRVDVVRVASNNPVEDEWAVAVGKGVGGNETLYTGVYDGHA
jgi:pyruvate dehydrogenase phosphatase